MNTRGGDKIAGFLRNNLLRGIDNAARLRKIIHHVLANPPPIYIMHLLMLCCANNGQNCARLLVEEFHAPLHTRRPKDGNTALHQAAYYGNFEVVQIILQWGGHNELKNKHRETPSDCAREAGFTEIAELIDSLKIKKMSSSQKASDVDEKGYLSKTLLILQNECTALFDQEKYDKAAALQPEINHIRTNIEDLELRPKHFALQSIKGKLAQLLQFCGPSMVSRIGPAYLEIYGEPLSLWKQYNMTLSEALGSIENVNIHEDEKTSQWICKLEKHKIDLTTNLICDFSANTPAALYETIMRIVQSGHWYRQNCPLQLRGGIIGHFETLFYFLHKNRHCYEKDLMRSSVLSSIIQDMLAGFYFHHKKNVTQIVRKQAQGLLQKHHKTIGNQVIIDGIVVLFDLDDSLIFSTPHLIELERDAGPDAEWIKEAVRNVIRKEEADCIQEEMHISDVKKYLQQKENDCKMLYEAGMYRDSARLQPQINKLKSVIEENGTNHQESRIYVADMSMTDMGPSDRQTPELKAAERNPMPFRQTDTVEREVQAQGRVTGRLSWKRPLVNPLITGPIPPSAQTAPAALQTHLKGARHVCRICKKVLNSPLQLVEHQNGKSCHPYRAYKRYDRLAGEFGKMFKENLDVKVLGFKSLYTFMASIPNVKFGKTSKRFVLLESISPEKDRTVQHLQYNMLGLFEEYGAPVDPSAAGLRETKLSAEQLADNTSHSSESVSEHETKHEVSEHEAKLVIDCDHVEDSLRLGVHGQLEQHTSIQPQPPTRVQHEPAASTHQKHGISEEIPTSASTASDSQSTPFVEEHGSSFVAPQNSEMQFAKIINLIDDAEEADPPLLNETDANSLQAFARNDDGELLLIFNTYEQLEESKRLKRFVKHAKSILKCRE